MPNDPVPMDFPQDRLDKVIVDLMNEYDAQQFVETIVTKYGSINAVVLHRWRFCNERYRFNKTSDISKQYKLNFETAYNVARPAFVQMLKQNSGRIFMVGSRPLA